MKFPKIDPASEIQCMIDSTTIGNNDLLGHFTLGYLAYRDEDLATAEKAFKKVIELDHKNPLAYHYLARLLTDLQRWKEGEIILKLAIENYLPYNQFINYNDLFDPLF